MRTILKFSLCIFVLSILPACVSYFQDAVEAETRLQLQLREKASVEDEKHNFGHLQFSRHNDQLVVGYGNGAFVYNIEQRRIEYDFPMAAPTKSVILSSGNRYLLVASSAHAKLWDFDRRQIIKQWDINNGLSIAIAPNEKSILIEDNLIVSQLWATQTKLTIFSASSNPRYSPNSQYLLVVGHLGKATLYDTMNQRVVRQLPSKQSVVSGFFSPDSARVFLVAQASSTAAELSKAKAKYLAVYRTRSGELLNKLKFNDSIVDIAFNQNDYTLFVVTQSGKATQWSKVKLLKMREWKYSSPATSMVADKNGNIWLALRNGQLLVYEFTTQSFNEIVKFPHSITELAISPSGKLLAVNLDLGTISRTLIFQVSAYTGTS